jgi:hypothetical protein
MRIQIRFQGFDDQILNKNLQLENKSIFFLIKNFYNTVEAFSPQQSFQHFET